MYILVILFLVFFQEESASVIRQDLVCTDFKSYSNFDRDKNCYYNPDLDSTPEQIINRYGFDLSEHTVTTEDGYILTIFRISSQNDKNNNSQKQPVILQHGIFVDGRTWFISGNNSLAFVIARNGFDLWIPNFRGGPYSDKHINPSISQKEYWKFSFHEIGAYDLPAIIDHVSNTTNRTDILYIGHSMGCTTFMVYSTMKEDHAQKHIKAVLHLAPVVYFEHPPPILQLVIPFTDIIKNTLDSLHIYAIGKEIKNIISNLGITSYPVVVGYEIGAAIVSGFVAEQVRPDLAPLIIKNFPTETSIKTLAHFSQIIQKHGRFQQYDYGLENLIKYKSFEPPQYEVEKAKIPTTIFAGVEDLLSEIRDVQKFYDHITAPKNMRVYNLSHLDYAFARDPTKVYKDIIDTLIVFENNSTIKEY